MKKNSIQKSKGLSKQFYGVGPPVSANLLLLIKQYRYQATKYNIIKSENCSKFIYFSFLNPMNGAQRSCQPHCFLFSYVRLVKCLYMQFDFTGQILIYAIRFYWPTVSYPLLGSKKTFFVFFKFSLMNPNTLQKPLGFVSKFCSPVWWGCLRY